VDKDEKVTGMDAFLKIVAKGSSTVIDQFEFSDYDDSDDETFEDSKEALSDTERSLLSPVDSLTPLFTENLQPLSNSSSMSTSTLGAAKRPAISPANVLQTKKPRAPPKQSRK